MKLRILFQGMFMVFLLFSCEQPEDQVIEAVNETKSLLQGYVWNLEEFTIDVKYEDIPPPVLFSMSDPLIESSVYDLDDMVFDASEMRENTVLFTSSRNVISSKGQIDVLGDSIATYFIFNDRTIRIKTEKNKFNYSYAYNESKNTMSFTLTSDQAESLIEDVNDKLIKAVSKQTPNKLGDAVAGLLYNNESIQKLINDLVVKALAGKLDFIHDFNPDEAAELLANKIIEQFGKIEWEEELTALLTQELEKITNIDPEYVAGEIAWEVASAINEILSTENVYNLVFPFLDELATNPDANAEIISTLIVDLFQDIFSQDNLKPIIANAWRNFTQLNEEQVSTIADTLTSVVEQVWINNENLSQLVLPFTQKIEETSLLQLGNLAAQTTDSIEVLIDNINIRFPDLNLEPDYASMESQIKAIFIAAKPIISIVGAEGVASEVADIVLSAFLSTENLHQVFVAAIHFLQELDPEIVGSVISGWLVNLTDQLAPEAIEYLAGLLSPILDNIDQEYTAFRIAVALNGFISENVTEENIQELIQPAIEFVSNINAEAVSRFIAQKLLSLDIIEDNINEDNIAAILLPVLQSISNINEEELVQTLINAVIASGIFEDVITEDRVSSIISLVIYNGLWENTKIANNFKEATIVLSHR